MMRTVLAVLAALAVLPAPLVHAGECAVSSGATRTSLIELYTSEGCSSCPPADQWLSRLRQDSVMLSVVPLALHVDYWDYIGWKDRFARPEFSQRQRTSAMLANSSLVYTPQVMLNGRDYRQWRNADRFERDLTTLARSAAPATIRLKIKQDTAAGVHIDIQAHTRREGPHALYLAVYENGLVSPVERGENAGTTLRHDAVVREWAGPLALNGKSATTWHHEVRISKDWNAKSAGIAAFIQNTATGEVLQAVSLPFCD